MVKKAVLHCDSDSQVFGALSFAKAFRERNWDITFILDRKASYPRGALDEANKHYAVRKMGNSEVLDVIEAENFDVVGFFSRASIINRFRRDAEKKWGTLQGRRPGIFTGFNGLSFEKSEEGFAWRMGYDAIALNGPRDKMLFDSFVANSPFTSQKAFVVGLRCGKDFKQYKKNATARSSTGVKNLVFAEQVDVPNDMLSRQYLASQLARIAVCNPDWHIHIKCRIKKNETTFHYLNHSFEDLLSEMKEKPNNISITYTPLEELFDQCDLLISVSSTAIFDSINRGIPTLAVADFGVRNGFGSHVFANSNLSIALSDIDEVNEDCFREPNQDWLLWVGSLDADPSELVDYFEKNKFNKNTFPPVYYSEAQVQLLEKLQNMTVFDSFKNAYRISISFIRRKIGV